ncbi:NAD(P)-dependent alcohol dehydrogenase [Aerococcaceae bacterium 50-4]
MKAAVYERYGDPEVLHLVDDFPKPSINASQILVKVIAASVNSGDGRIRGLQVEGVARLAMRTMMGWSAPKNPILGTVFAGVVEAIGESVTEVEVGQAIVGSLGMKTGTYAEYVVLESDGIYTTIPKNLSFNEAAAIPFGGLTALSFMTGYRMPQNAPVMVYGAGGAVGTAAIQVAKNLGYRVTAVARERHHNIATTLGADYCLDYTKDEFQEDTHRYALIFDCVGVLDKKDVENKLNPGGHFASVGGMKVAKETKEHLEVLMSWVKDCHYQAVIDRVYPIEDIVTAHEYLDTKQKQGNIVVEL